MTTTTPTTDDLDLLHAVAESAELHLVSARRISAEAASGGFTVGFETTLADESGQQIRRLIYVETAPSGPERDGVLRFHDDDGDERAVWVYPNDPALPALADAVVPTRAASLLRELAGIDADASALGVSVLAYRPGKRAVVRCETGGETVFLKVVLPDVARRLAERHDAWVARGIPVPAALGWDARGLVALEAAPGVPALDALSAAGPRADLDAFLDAVVALRTRVAEHGDPRDAPARASLARRISWYVRRVRRLAPELADRLSALAARVDAAVQRASPSATIHGDLHLGQIFVDPNDASTLTALIDIDTAGIGDPADDEAALWAHLIASARFAQDRDETERAALTEDLAGRARARWTKEHDPEHRVRVAGIVATHLLGHALTGVLTPVEAVTIAEGLLADPEDENRLSKTS